jgi:hypothetical protein
MAMYYAFSRGEQYHNILLGVGFYNHDGKKNNIHDTQKFVNLSEEKKDVIL